MAKTGKKKNRSPRAAAPSHPTTRARSSADDIKLIFRIALIIVAGFVIYWPALSGAWLWDDRELVADNQLIHDPDGIWKIWLTPLVLYDFLPLKVSVEWIEWRLWGEDTVGYHVVSLCLHLLSAFLLWRLLARFGLRYAWIGGLIFVVHPVLVESVAWMAELKNTLSMPFFLLAMMALIDFDTRGRRRDFIAALVLFTLALLAKPSMVMFPFVILLYAWWKRKRIVAKDFLRSAPFFAVSLAVGLATLWFLHRTPGEQAVVLGDPISRVACAGLSLAFYFSKCFLPVGLMTIYPKWSVDPPSPEQFLPWFVIGGVLYYLWTKRKSWGRHALLGLGFFLITLAPFIGLNAGSYMTYTWVMDHLVYVPILGLIGLTVAGWEQFEGQLAVTPRRVAEAIAIGVLALMAWASWNDAATYVTLEAQWRHNIEENPNAALPHNDLGVALGREGRTVEALAEFRLATELDPSYNDAHRNYGISLLQAGDAAGGLKQFEILVQHMPRLAEAHYQLGIALGNLGRVDESNDQYRQAIALVPTYLSAYNNLAANLSGQGHIPEAIGILQAALRIDPANEELQRNLTKLFAMQNQGKTRPSK